MSQRPPAFPSTCRRRFLRSSASLAATTPLALTGRLRGAETPSNRIRIGAMGTSRNEIGGDGRGTTLAKQLAALSGVEIAYVCDVGQRNVNKAIAAAMENQDQKPRGVSDFRRILDDSSVDALVIATPDHLTSKMRSVHCPRLNSFAGLLPPQ